MKLPACRLRNLQNHIKSSYIREPYILVRDIEKALDITLLKKEREGVTG